MASVRWFFLNKKNEVLGPFEKWEIELQLVAEPDGLVWGSGMNDWLQLAEWRNRVQLLEEVMKELESNKSLIWHYQDGPTLAGPFNYHDLIQELKKCVDSSQVLIRRSPHKKMRPIYEWPILVEETGLSRRQHIRVPIQAEFKYRSKDGIYQKKLNTISEGGFSLLGCTEHFEGDLVTGQMISVFLKPPVYCSAIMIHSHKNGICSFRFQELSAESALIIKKYAAQFKSS
jgi:hypothetical protein